MSLVMIEPGQLSPFAFSFYITSRPAGIFAFASLTQQHVQYSPNLGNRQSRGVFFSPDVFPESKTIMQ